MTLLRGRQIVAAINLVRPSSEFDDGGSTAASVPNVPFPLQPLGSEDGDSGSLALVPNLYLSWEALRDRLWAGVGVNVPFGLKTEWSEDWMGRFHGTDSEVQTINVNPSLAVKVLPWLSLGAGVNYQWITAELANAVNYTAAALAAGGAPALGALAATCPGAVTSGPTAGTGCAGIARIKGDDRSWGWNVGVMADFPTTGTRVGASYRSAIEHEIEGNVTFGNVPPPLAGAVRNGDIRADIELPATVSVAVAQEVLRNLQLLADFTWTEWSSIQALNIFRSSGAGLTSTPLKFDDSWRVGLGANYRLTDMWKLRAGVAYDRTPVQDEDRTPRLPDQDRTWVAGGAQWSVTPAIAIDAGVAWLFIRNASSNLPNIDPAPPPGFTAPPRGNLVGTYEANVWIASAQARYSF
jgi:long-chain fatty acid transport protein